MLLGQFEGKIDEKFRLSFPKKFREVLGEAVILTKGLDGNIIIVSQEKWETLLEGTEGKPFIHKDTRELQRFLLGNATQVTPDEKGRFLIPQFLREHAKLTHEVIFAGMKRFVELWDKKTWEEEQKRLDENIPSIAERLSSDGSKE